MYELREQRKLITKGTKFFERFDWTNTRLTKVEKQAVEDILVEYHDIFAKHGMVIGMKKELT